MSGRTAKEMIELLHGHYIAPSKPAGGYFAPELTAPNSSRRADLIWLPLTSQERGRIVGHEVKVSRADVVQELADPTKADAWARYCSQWWLVVADPSLVDGLTIPDRWGIMAPPSGRRRRSMTIVRPAPELRPDDAADALATILARMFFAGDDAEARIAVAEERAERAKADADAWSERYHDAYSRLSALGELGYEQELAQDLIRGLREARVGELYRYARPETATIVAAALDHAVVARRTADMIARLDRAVKQVGTLSEFGALMEKLTGMRRRIESELAELAIPEDQS